MSKVLFISDLHLGHANILNWAKEYRQGDTIKEHDDWVISSIASRLSKRDTLYILGDVCLRSNQLHRIAELTCENKILVRGNHDDYPLREYLNVFNDIQGLVRYKGAWLSHAPVHPDELRGKFNIHGHVHMNSIPDGRYFNACVEALKGVPISFQEIMSIMKERGQV